MLQLLELAKSTRGAFERFARSKMDNTPAILSGWPKGCCGVASDVLGLVIREQLGLEPSWVSAEKYRGQKRITHAWIEVNNIWIDITADQFNQDPIIVDYSKNCKWHHKWKINKKYPALDFGDESPAGIIAASIYDGIITNTHGRIGMDLLTR